MNPSFLFKILMSFRSILLRDILPMLGVHVFNPYVAISDITVLHISLLEFRGAGLLKNRRIVWVALYAVFILPLTFSTLQIAGRANTLNCVSALDPSRRP